MKKRKINLKIHVQLLVISLFSCLKFGFSQQIDSTNLSPLDSLNKMISYQIATDSLFIQAWADSMRARIHGKISADSLQIKKKLDSLAFLQLPTMHYERKLDSLADKKRNMLDEVNNQQKELQSKATQKIYSWKQKVIGRLDSLGMKGNLPETTLPATQKLSIPDFDLPEIPSVSANDFSGLELSPDLSKINTDLPFGSVDGLTGIQANITGIKERTDVLNQLKTNPDRVIEQAVNAIDEVKEIEKFKGFENPVAELQVNDPEAIKEKIKDQAINHFAGREEQLHEAISQISKYKQKYSSTQSLKDLPKKAPNEMKDKPFIERLVPGVSFQYQFNNNYLLDIYSYTGYRVTGRITTGLGWNQRLARDKANTYWNHKAAIYGPRVFGNYRLGKGMIAQIEIESMNTFVSYSRTDPQIGQREWVWSTMTGMKKVYRITKNLNGTVLVLYNIFDPKHKSPYNDRLNTRFGFEYTIKKKQKTTKQN